MEYCFNKEKYKKLHKLNILLFVYFIKSRNLTLTNDKKEINFFLNTKLFNQ